MRRLLIGLMVGVLVACANHGPAPISERYQSSELNPDSYRVLKGDTLFSIAFRYGKTVDQLAAYNHIKPPYTIYIGQRLALSGVMATKPTVVAKNVVKPNVANPSTPPKKSNPPPAKIASNEEQWHWPLQAAGKVTASFVNGSDSNKGIDLVAPKGTPVLAAKSGQVVYAGSGLPGYGNLLIIKHDPLYLSAYAHNDRLLVKEGDTVKARQHVANLGSTASLAPKLHFEIRRDGRPVDPLQYVRRP